MSEALGTIEEQAGQWCFNLGINIGVAPPGGSNQDEFPPHTNDFATVEHGLFMTGAVEHQRYLACDNEKGSPNGGKDIG